MAENWIKVEKATPGKPEVLGIAAELGIHPNEAFGLCVRFWMWADDQLISCHAKRVTKNVLDAHIGRDGLADALVSVGWLQVREGSLEVPNFDRHLGKSAKTRALSSERAKNRRSDVTQSASTVSRKLRDEKRTLSISLSKGELEASFDAFWSIYPIKQSKKPARAAWEKAIKRESQRMRAEDACEKIANAAQDYRDFLEGHSSPPNGKYAQGWLNDEMYDNDYPQLLADSLKKPAATTPGQRRVAATQEAIAGFANGNF